MFSIIYGVSCTSLVRSEALIAPNFLSLTVSFEQYLCLLIVMSILLLLGLAMLSFTRASYKLNSC